MLDVMYDIPSMRDIARVVIDEECVTEHKPPRIVTHSEANALRSA